MKLDGIVSLHKSMRNQGIDRYQFEYKVNGVVFDVLFFIDDDPYELFFGAKSTNFTFSVKVQKGFEISHELDKAIYKSLCAVLGLRFDPNNPFSPLKFFKEFNSNIPDAADPHKTVKPHDIARYKPDVEESEKKYFCGWRDNTKVGKRVTEANLDKTKKYLGVQAYLTCMKKNISSCWTVNAEAAIEFAQPA